MAQQAIGMIETRGLVALVEGVDAMLKAANVELAGPMVQVGNALVTATVVGDVAAVKEIAGPENPLPLIDQRAGQRHRANVNPQKKLFGVGRSHVDILLVPGLGNRQAEWCRLLLPPGRRWM